MLTITTNFALAFWKSDTLEPLGSQPLPHHWRSAWPSLSPKGTQLALGLPDGAVQVWDVSSRQKAPVLHKELLPPGPGNSERRFAWSPDGTRLAAFFGGIYVFDLVQDRLIRKLPIQWRPYSMAISPDGNKLAVGWNRILELWDLTTGVKVSSWEGHTEFTRDLGFSPDGKTLVSANNDNTAKLWEVPSGKLKAALTNHKLTVLRLAFSPDGRTLATLGVDAFKLWSVQTGQELMTLEQFPLSDSNWQPSPGRVVFSPDGTRLALGYYSPSRIQFWRAPALSEIERAERNR
jgi:WD40 repeat protein